MRIQSMSNPTLVAMIRRLTKDQIVWKLTHGGKDPSFSSILHAAQAEAQRRHLIINHPEHIDDPAPSEGD